MLYWKIIAIGIYTAVTAVIVVPIFMSAIDNIFFGIAAVLTVIYPVILYKITKSEIKGYSIK